MLAKMLAVEAPHAFPYGASDGGVQQDIGMHPMISMGLMSDAR